MKKIYSRFRNRLNDRHRGTLSRLAFAVSRRPRVRKDAIPPAIKFPNNEKGGLIISADFEMAWAWRYTKTGADHIHKGGLERKNIPAIINILEKYNIPVTFATVGHLFLEKCEPGEHDRMARIPYFDDHWKFMNGDWFDHDPHSNYKESPEWYAPDLIRMILGSRIRHEIGCHTFSHIDVSDKNCPADVVADEIQACLDAALPYGVRLKSMVFPGGRRTEILKY